MSFETVLRSELADLASVVSLTDQRIADMAAAARSNPAPRSRRPWLPITVGIAASLIVAVVLSVALHHSRGTGPADGGTVIGRWTVVSLQAGNSLPRRPAKPFTLTITASDADMGCSSNGVTITGHSIRFRYEWAFGLAGSFGGSPCAMPAIPDLRLATRILHGEVTWSSTSGQTLTLNKPGAGELHLRR